MKKSEALKVLQAGWLEFNRILLQATETECNLLLVSERGGQARKRVLLRIHSRLNKLRAHRERKELEKEARA